MAKSVAILLDGGFILKKLPKDSCNCNSVYSFALSCFKTTEEELFRIFFYHCSPYDGVQTHPITHARIDFSQTSVAIQMRELVEQLSELNYVAIRKGHLAFRGWAIKKFTLRNIQKQGSQKPTHSQQASQFGYNFNKGDFEPNLTQKEVDIKIGLDVAWLSSKRIVDKIILVTGDTDLVPAMKFARREGVQVVIVDIIQGNQGYLKSSLKEHADEIRKLQFNTQTNQWAIFS